MKGILFIFLVIHPFLTNGQRGYTLTNESGDIIVTVRDTIDTGNGIIHKSETIEFVDSAAAAIYLDVLKDNYFITATNYAQLARADSITARRIETIGSDAGLFSIPAPPPANDIPALIEIPQKAIETKKEPAKKPKTKKKKQ